MLASIKQRLGREDEGFTLIELMVVLLIIAILLAIAIPTFLGARNTANARSTQENLRNALTAEQSTWTNTQAFDPATTDMLALEPSLDWVNGTIATNTTGNEVSVSVGTDGTVFLVGYAKDGNCYYVEQNNTPATSGASETGYLETNAATGGCAIPAATYQAVTPGSAAKTVGTWSSSF